LRVNKLVIFVILWQLSVGDGVVICRWWGSYL